MKCKLKLKDKPPWTEINGIERYANIIFVNIYSNYFILDTVDRYIVYSFRSSNIECCMKLKNENK